MDDRRVLTRNLRFKDEGLECIQELADALKRIQKTSSENEIREMAESALERYRYKNHRVRFTKTENAILISKAASSGLAVSDYIRKAAMHRVGRAPSPKFAVVALLEVLEAIKRRYPLDRETPAILIAAIRKAGGVVNDL